MALNVNIDHKKTYTLMPYIDCFKKGDDFQHFLSQYGNDVLKALSAYADMLLNDAATVVNIKKILSESNVKDLTAEGQTHCIWIHCDGETAEKLLNEKLCALEVFDEDVEVIVDEDTLEDDNR